MCILYFVLYPNFISRLLSALTVACSFCVQSAILSALIRSPYGRWTTTAATAARTKTRTGRRLYQQRQLQGRRNRQRQPWQQPRTTVAKCISWLRTGAVRTQNT